MMYDLPEVFQLYDEELNKNLSNKLYTNRSTVFLMLVGDNLQ